MISPERSEEQREAGVVLSGDSWENEGVVESSQKISISKIDIDKTGRNCRRRKKLLMSLIKKKLDKKYSAEQIAEMLEIDISEVKKIIKEI